MSDQPSIVEFLTERWYEIEPVVKPEMKRRGPGYLDPFFAVPGKDWSRYLTADPAYVLADIAAKRRILAEHQPREWAWGSTGTCPACADWDTASEVIEMAYPCPTVRLLASPFASHEAYDPAWSMSE